MTISMSTCHLILSLNSQVLCALPSIVLVAMILFNSPTLVLGHNKTRPMQLDSLASTNIRTKLL